MRFEKEKERYRLGSARTDRTDSRSIREIRRSRSRRRPWEEHVEVHRHDHGRDGRAAGALLGAGRLRPNLAGHHDGLERLRDAVRTSSPSWLLGDKSAALDRIIRIYLISICSRYFGQNKWQHAGHGDERGND